MSLGTERNAALAKHHRRREKSKRRRTGPEGAVRRAVIEGGVLQTPLSHKLRAIPVRTPCSIKERASGLGGTSPLRISVSITSPRIRAESSNETCVQPL